MFRAETKGAVALHRVGMHRAISALNSELSSSSDSSSYIVLVGTKNLLTHILSSLLSGKIYVLYFTGFGRLYTDYGLLGRLLFVLVVLLWSVRRGRYFIVENGEDRAFLERFTRCRVFEISGSGFDSELYRFGGGGGRRSRSSRSGRSSDSSKSGRLSKSGSSGRYVLGHMSRFGYSKCTDEILKLIDGLPSNYSIVIAGKDIVGSYYSDIFWSLSAERENVEMVGYLENLDEVSSFFRSIDLFLYPSLREGLPVTLLESLYHRVPFLTTDVAGCVDLSSRLGFPVLSPSCFGSGEYHLDIESWGSWCERWDDILGDFSQSRVQAQFESIFSEVVRDSAC